MQDAAHAFPGLIDLLSISYLTFHLAVTVAVLLWLHRRRPAAFPLVRTTLVIASGLALVGYLVYPTAPPRMAGIGIADTVSGGHVDLNSGLVSSLYNPLRRRPQHAFRLCARCRRGRGLADKPPTRSGGGGVLSRLRPARHRRHRQPLPLRRARRRRRSRRCRGRRTSACETGCGRRRPRTLPRTESAWPGARVRRPRRPRTLPARSSGTCGRSPTAIRLLRAREEVCLMPPRIEDYALLGDTHTNALVRGRPAEAVTGGRRRVARQAPPRPSRAA